ncbi:MULTISPECIES: site-specific DNA-methyltransferase [Gammaproteobacteria]|uniref:site-specific DNA-methyltransferase n=1 Tax=Gammaproteobacteria TaxID=1236 RepID=UPI0006D9AC2C|nr:MULTISPECIES: site-specific DNA-methyltransferase [Gammaproteobacteria]KPN77914.1 DNA methylase N-4 [Shewanella sp. Sh95]QIF99289.1 site-specific DNA-methyltransferase [Proteus terrae subsp. cibarius]UWJ08319.1 site-specific DNA-methyltransferase [Proteus mirabilis]
MNNIKNNKLELSWIGKDKLPRLEPRIFLESKEYSYFNVSVDIGQDSEQEFSNLLIKSDNLLALKALEQDYTSKVKCIVIDPPYNTGSAFSHYDDGLEHSMWLTLMRDRLVLLHQLLSEDGSLWITIDDNESHYLKVMCDEIFGRANFVTDITWQRKYSVSNNFKGIASICDRILVYRKSDKFVNNLLPRTEDSVARYKNPDNDPRGPWKSVDYLNQATPEKRPNLCYDITNPNTGEVIKNTKKAWKYDRETHRKHIEEKRIWWGINGTNTTPAVKLFLSEVRDGMTPHNWWPHEDVGHTDEAKKEIIQLFGRKDVFDTPKPERLIQRILTIATNPGDLVLDSFAGSGTTGAVAQKMGRRWIMVELGEHCDTHIVPRLKKVIDGEDQGGISKAVNWQGGGGFRYLRLAPSLLQKDEWGNWVINKEYNAEMLSAAMCKHMGFTYAPSETQFWNHGYSTETDFIYVTTGSLAYDQLKRISEDVGEDRTLLICCKAFMSEGAEFPNLTIKKIPQSILNKCEWDNDDYSFTLNVLAEPEEYELDDEDDQ